MWRRTWVGALAVLGLLAGGTASAARQPDNLAFVDLTSTQAIMDYAGTALTAVLTYDYRGLDENLRMAGEKGTEKYAGQHTAALDGERATITRQKHQVATKVVEIGVREQGADTARLIVFLDQTTTRGDTNKASTTAVAAVVDLKLVGGQWKLDGLTNLAAS